MGDKPVGRFLGGNQAKSLNKAVERALPEWQVFVRRPDGSGSHFKVGTRRQLALLALAAALGLWAGVATVMLARQPDVLASRQHELDRLISDARSAQQRLADSQAAIGDMVREVDAVQTNLATLAETNATLARETKATRLAPPAIRTRASVTQPAKDDAADELHDQVRRLEASLDRLHAATAKAVQNTTAAVDRRVEESAAAMDRLGFDTERLLARVQAKGGKGGPYVPPSQSRLGDGGLAELIARTDKLVGVKALMQKLPLAPPLHEDYDINSGFGARNDPLNNRTGIHEGVDLGAPYGAPVYATGEGVVSFAGNWDRYGQIVEIDHGNGVTTRYAHLSRIKVQEGQKVTRATVVGLLGNTGRSTGAHLHYEVRIGDLPRDPLKFISALR